MQDLLRHYHFLGAVSAGRRGKRDADGITNALLQENAEIVDGKLDVGGNSQTADAWAITDSDAGEYIGPTIRNKTLISWVLMEKVGPRVRAGSVITLDSVTGDVFDGIIYGERQVGRWMSGSSGFRRTQDFKPGYIEKLSLIHI